MGGGDDALLPLVVDVAGVGVAQCRGVIRRLPPGDLCFPGFQWGADKAGTDFHDLPHLSRGSAFERREP